MKTYWRRSACCGGGEEVLFGLFGGLACWNSCCYRCANSVVNNMFRREMVKMVVGRAVHFMIEGVHGCGRA